MVGRGHLVVAGYLYGRDENATTPEVVERNTYCCRAEAEYNLDVLTVGQTP